MHRNWEFAARQHLAFRYASRDIGVKMSIRSALGGIEAAGLSLALSHRRESTHAIPCQLQIYLAAPRTRVTSLFLRPIRDWDWSIGRLDRAARALRPSSLFPFNNGSSWSINRRRCTSPGKGKSARLAGPLKSTKHFTRLSLHAWEKLLHRGWARVSRAYVPLVVDSFLRQIGFAFFQGRLR